MPAAVLGISRPAKHMETYPDIHMQIYTLAQSESQWEVGQTRRQYYQSPWISGADCPRGASCHNSPDCTAFWNACRVNLSMMRGRQWCHHHPLRCPLLNCTYTSLHLFPSIAISVWCRVIVHKCFVVAIRHARFTLKPTPSHWKLEMLQLACLFCFDWSFPVFA